MTDDSLAAKTMRKLQQAFREYEVAIENLEQDVGVPAHYDPAKFFMEQIDTIVRASLTKACEIALRQTMTDIRESLADLRSYKE